MEASRIRYALSTSRYSDFTRTACKGLMSEVRVAPTDMAPFTLTAKFSLAADAAR
jgi:hypothetical protein